MRSALLVLSAVGALLLPASATGHAAASLNQVCVTTASGSPIVCNSGHYSERLTSVPITKPPGPNPWQPIMCLDLGSPLSPGQVIVVQAEAEVTSPVQYNVDVEARLMLSPACETGDGSEISDSTGRNITANMHHDTLTKVGSLAYDGTTRQWVVFAIAVESNAALPGQALVIEPDHGRIIIERY